MKKEHVMKKVLMSAGAIAAICTTSAALADGGWDPSLDEVILINGGEAFTQSSDESMTFEVTLDSNPNPVIGFSFAGVVQGIEGTATWASDTRLDIIAPDGTSHSIGGFGQDDTEDWDFQGSQSTDDGLYTHGLGSEFGDGEPDFVFDKIAKGGTWSFTFTQTFGTDVTWKGVSINLHKQAALPAPGAIALLGLAGLAGTRRRRA